MKPDMILRTTGMLKDERGTTGVLFGLMAVPLITMMGIALDYGRALHTQDEIQRIIDGATIAALNEYRTNTSTNTADKSAAAQTRMLAYIDAGLKNSGLARQTTQNKQGSVVVTNTAIDTTTSTAAPKIEAQVKTTVLGMVGVKTLTVKAETKVAVAAAQLKGTKALELSVVLDLSGSMAGTKITDMKSAAQDFLDIVMPDDLAVDNRRVGLVPFSTRVNVGSDFAAASTGLSVTKNIQTGTSTSKVFSTSSFSWQSKSNCGSLVKQTTAYSSYSTTQAQNYCIANFNYNSSSQKYWTPAVVSQTNPVYTNKTLYGCVTERQGSEAYTDASPSTSPVGWYNPDSSEDSQYSTTGLCMMTPTNSYTSVEFPSIKALTSNKQSLKSHIDTFKTFGNTAGHLATAWSWYMLSPEWNSVWPSTAQVTEYNNSDTIKAAVIMTDGEYNNSLTTTSAADQARNVCTAMKAKGIRVYTIGFDMTTTSTAAQLLRDCASPNSYYFPYDGTALRTAFQEIGNSLVTIVTKSSDGTSTVLQQ